MKKKVVIEKAPSSKRKVVIEGLPKAQAGIITTGRDPQMVQQTEDLLLNKINRDKDSSKLGITSSARPQDYDLMMQNQKMLQDKIQSDKAKVKKFFTPNKNVKFNVPHFYPTVGNRYLQEAVMDFNDAATYASNIGRQPKDITIPTPNYNQYANTYWGQAADGGYLPMAQWGTYQYEQPSYATPPSNLQPLNVQMPAYQTEQNPQLTPTAPTQTEGLQEIELNKDNYKGSSSANPWVTAGAIAGTVAKIGSGVTHGLKGGADIAGTVASNKGKQLAENQLYTQSVFSDAMNVTPYETQGYGFLGRNSLAADGMQIKEVGGYGEPNVEVEGNEHIQLPNGFSQEIKGKSHAEGGIPLNLPSGTKIFSEKLKVPVKFLMELIQINPEYAFLKNISLPKTGSISYADLAKKFETKKYVDLLNSKDADPIQKATAQLMIKQKNQKLDELFALQEKNKLSGVHGEEVQFNAMQEQQESAQQESQEPQQEQEEPMMMHGGYHLPKADDGKYVNIGGKQVYAVKVKQPGKEYKAVPNMPGYYYKEVETRIPGTTGTPAVPGKKYTPVENAWWKSLTPEQKAAHNAKVRKMIQTDPLYTGTPAIEGTPEKVTKAEDYVYIEPDQQIKPMTPQAVNKTYEMPGMGIGIGLPNAYERLPLNYYKIEPQYVEAPIEQPYTYDIDRAMRAGITNATDLSGTGIADRLQAFSSGIGEKGKRYYDASTRNLENKFRADMANAQAKTGVNQYNQGSWFQQLEDPIRRRESAIGDQELTDYYRGRERGDEAQAYGTTKDYMTKTFPNYQNMTGDQIADYLATTNPKFMQLLSSAQTKEKKKKDDTETTSKEKYGGKVKIKPKLKKKY